MKTYIKPEIKIQNVVVEQLLASESGDIDKGDAKRHDSFWTDDDFFDDTSWPKNESQWD